MNTTTIIYVLVDPRDKKVFYVGRTRSLLTIRLDNHIRDGKKRGSLRAQRIASILGDGLKPDIVEIINLGIVDLETAIIAEEAWIDFYTLTHDLTNTGSSRAGGHTFGGRIKWTDEAIASLGKVPDSVVALLLNCSPKTIARERVKRSILTYSEQQPSSKDIPDAILQLLGKSSDSQIAKLTGFCPEIIRRIRVSRNIPACPQFEIQSNNLPENILQFLGKVSDMEVAKMSGLSSSAISQLRNKLGIAPCPRSAIEANKSSKIRTLPQWVIDSMGTMPDAQLAKLAEVGKNVIKCRRNELNITPFAVTYSQEKRDLPPEIIQKLGLLSDSAIADMSGVEKTLIRKIRNELGIPPNGRHKNRILLTMPDSVREQLGKASDHQIARQLGVGHTTVRCARMELGIPAFKKIKD